MGEPRARHARRHRPRHGLLRRDRLLAGRQHNGVRRPDAHADTHADADTVADADTYARADAYTDAGGFEFYGDGGAAVVVTVRRTGDLARPAGVDYATADGTAREGYDYIMASGTLTFAAGESARQVRVLLVNDAHGEQDEAFTLTLSNPWGGCSLGSPHAAALTIGQNDATPAGVNPVDESASFVYRHLLEDRRRT